MYCTCPRRWSGSSLMWTWEDITLFIMRQGDGTLWSNCFSVTTRPSAATTEPVSSTTSSSWSGERKGILSRSKRKYWYVYTLTHTHFKSNQFHHTQIRGDSSGVLASIQWAKSRGRQNRNWGSRGHSRSPGKPQCLPWPLHCGANFTKFKLSDCQLVLLHSGTGKLYM